MRLVIQRVSRAQVEVANEVVGKIARGFLILVGIGLDDTEGDIAFLARKTAGLRIFDDDQGKMNCSLAEVDGTCLVISQFTLYGDCRKGNRPSYTASEHPDKAAPMVDAYVNALQSHGLDVETGVFGADMKVDLLNDGPVTLILESSGRE